MPKMPTSHRKKIIMEHQSYWDILSKIEIPILKIIQKITLSSILHEFWYYGSKIGSSTVLSFSPMVLFSLGLTDKSIELSYSLAFHTFLSSLGKTIFHRRRPCSYPEFYIKYCSSSSSFPSRHTMSATVLANFTPIKWPIIIFMILDRMALSQHYLSDCIVGYILGEISVLLGKHLKNINLAIVIFLGAQKMWFSSSCAKIFAGSLSIICLEKIACTPFLMPLVFIRLLIEKYPMFKKSYPIANELYASSLTMFIITALNSLFYILRQKGIISNAIWNVHEAMTNKLKLLF